MNRAFERLMMYGVGIATALFVAHEFALPAIRQITRVAEVLK
jgi:hypothetical protein